MNLYGNYTALVTPFRKNKEVDYKALEKLVEFQLNNQTDGIVALGSTAEAPTLDEYQKHKIMETILEKTKGEVPIIAGINAFSLENAIDQAHQRYVDGASALLVSPPPYIKPTKTGLLTFYKTLAEQCYIPIIIYNIPSRTGVNIPIEVVQELATLPNIIGIKEASGDLIYTLTLSNITKTQNFTLIAGNDNLLLPLLSINAKAIISVVGNVCPKLCHDIIDLFNQNKPKEAFELYLNNQELIDCLSLETNPIPIKYLLYKLKMVKPYYQDPLCLPDKHTKTKINQILDKLTIL